MCTDAYRGRGESRLMCTYPLTLSLLINLTLHSFKNGVFVRNGLISVVMKKCFYFKLFFRTIVSQNAFNFNKIES